MQSALVWLKHNNHAYSDIVISQERLGLLPENGELPDIATVEYDTNVRHGHDHGPAPDQVDPGNGDGKTHSSVLLPQDTLDLRVHVQSIVQEVVGEGNAEVTANRRGTLTIPWPTNSDSPLSEFTTRHFSPWLFLLFSVITTSIAQQLALPCPTGLSIYYGTKMAVLPDIPTSSLWFIISFPKNDHWKIVIL